MFPDVHQIIYDMVAEGDKVAVYLKATATHKGDLNGPIGLVHATGKKAGWEGVIFLRLKNGKIIETKGVIDNMSLMQQLGAIPKP
jgi:predicted ester cyclase